MKSHKSHVFSSQIQIRMVRLCTYSQTELCAAQLSTHVTFKCTSHLRNGTIFGEMMKVSMSTN